VGSSTDADFRSGERYVVGASRSFTTDARTATEAEAASTVTVPGRPLPTARRVPTRRSGRSHRPSGSPASARSRQPAWRSSDDAALGKPVFDESDGDGETDDVLLREFGAD
jgi:hypothetical protein